MADFIGNSDLFRARLVGICLEAGICRRSAVESGDDNGRDAALCNLIEDPGSSPDMLSCSILADEPPVFYPGNTGDRGNIVTH